MTPQVTTVTRKALRTRRSELLRRAGVSREELQSRAERAALSGDEYEIVSELEDIEFLLDES